MAVRNIKDEFEDKRLLCWLFEIKTNQADGEFQGRRSPRWLTELTEKSMFTPDNQT